ncbi:hypothetical protein [Parabacteroides goldsteinii]|uniref:hypothetical protein n=1 Tax=Parabacteroides goldsteinii TaxID=328812 RepID=UPI0032B29D55
MKIRGLIRTQGEKKGRDRVYDIQVDAVFSPSNTYLVGIGKNYRTNDDKKEKYYKFEYRNIISLIYGTIKDENLSFSIQIAVLSSGDGLMNQIIHTVCNENENYVFDYETDDYVCGERLYILNMNDLQTLPEFANQTTFECIQHYVDVLEEYDHNLRFEFCKPVSQQKYMNLKEFADYTNDKY